MRFKAALPCLSLAFLISSAAAEVSDHVGGHDIVARSARHKAMAHKTSLSAAHAISAEDKKKAEIRANRNKEKARAARAKASARAAAAKARARSSSSSYSIGPGWTGTTKIVQSGKTGVSAMQLTVVDNNAVVFVSNPHLERFIVDARPSASSTQAKTIPSKSEVSRPGLNITTLPTVNQKAFICRPTLFVRDASQFATCQILNLDRSVYVGAGGAFLCDI